jgi:hypothetical protein
MCYVTSKKWDKIGWCGKKHDCKIILHCQCIFLFLYFAYVLTVLYIEYEMVVILWLIKFLNLLNDIKSKINLELWIRKHKTENEYDWEYINEMHSYWKYILYLILSRKFWLYSFLKNGFLQRRKIICIPKTIFTYMFH